MKRRMALLLVTALLAACGTPGDAGTIESTQPTTTTSTSPPTTLAVPATSTTTASVPSTPIFAGVADSVEITGALVALANDGVQVYDSPGDDEPFLELDNTTLLGSTTVLTLVGEPEDGWAEVMLPIRPNDRNGWIRVDDVHLYVVDGVIDISLSDRELVYTVDGEERFRATVAIGTPRNSTPTGTFFVTDSVSVRDGSGPWGPHALAFNARSDTITEFNGGDGIVGVHGTNQPGTIGEAVSLGCVRLPNDLITLLHSMVPIGTPVIIRA